MKVLQINSVCKSGSTGKIAYELYRRGNSDGHEFAVCYGRGKKLHEDGIFKFGLDLETYAHAFLTRITGWTGCFSPLSTKRLLRYMDEFKPDIVHLHEPHAYFLDLVPFFNYLADRKIPLIYTFHCEFAFTGKCGYSYDCEGYIKGCGNCPRLKEYPKTVCFDHTAEMYSEKKELLLKQDMLIAAPSSWLAEKAKRSFLSGFRIMVVKNGIDSTGVFYPREYEHLKAKHGIGDEKIVLAVAPSFISDERKGAKHVIDLARRMDGQAVRFIMIGADKPVEDLPGNVIVLGRTEDQAELAEYYSMADCFVICSVMENLPTTCLEAVCCGTPVVGFDVGGTAETAPVPLGSFVAYGDMEALEMEVRGMLAAPPSPEAFREYGVKYSSRYMYEAYLKLYEELLEGKQK